MAALFDFLAKLSGSSALKKLSRLNKAYGRLQKSFGDVGGSAKAASSVTSLGESAGGAVPSMEGLSGGATASGASVGGMAGPIGIAVVAIVLLTAALVAVIVKLSEFALKSADAARNASLMQEAAAGSAAAGAKESAAIERVAHSSSLAASEIQKLGQSLSVAGLSGAQFEPTLKSLATLSTTVGPGAASALEEVAKKSKELGHFKVDEASLQKMGLSMDELAKKMGISVAKLKADMAAGKITTENGLNQINEVVKKRYGDVAAKQMLGFDAQMLKLKENLAALFKDVKIEGFLKGMKSMLSVFDQSTSQGKALHLIITTVFSGIFNAASKAFPYIKAFLTGVIIGMLTFYIYAMKVWRAIDRFGGGKSKVDWIKVAMWAGVVAFGAVIGVVVVLIALMAVLAMAMLLPWLPVIITIAILVGAFLLIRAAIDQAKAWFADFQLPDLGGAATNMIDGLIDGISGSVGRVMAAVTGLGSSIKGALASVLDMHSPSKAFAFAGRMSGEGYAEGAEDSTDKAQAATAAMVEPPDPKGVAGKKGKGKGGSGPLLWIEHLELVGQSARDIWAELEPQLIALLERVELQGPDPTGG